MSPATNNRAIPRSPRILSIQSHVVSGYCGNKSATFPLQLLEFEVDVINTVQLSNHTQYKVARGQIFGSNDLKQIHAGLKENNLLKLYDCILSGYVADSNYVESMADLIKDIKKEKNLLGSSCFYSLDPVLGDDGAGFYVPNGPRMAEAYKNHLFPLADMITPNRFEASVLSGINIDPESPDSIGEAVKAINVLHKQTNIKLIALTSLQFTTTKDELICIVSHWPEVEACNHNGARESESMGSIWTVSVPKLKSLFTGTGDLFTALLTGWLQKTDFNVEVSLGNTINTIHEILLDTEAWIDQFGESSVQTRELRLVQNKCKIVNPKIHLTVNSLKVDRETNSLSATKVQASDFSTSARLPLTE